jgi:voltage-gated sodium channel
VISREQARALIASRLFQNTVTATVVANAAVLGLELSRVDAAMQASSLFADVALAIFVIEMTLKLYADDVRVFTHWWNVFDVAVVAIAVTPGNGVYSALRLFRVLPLLRYLPGFPTMNLIVGALFAVTSGLIAFVVLLAMAIYPAAIMATNTFGDISPHFEDISTSAFTLFQILTGNWSDVVRETMYSAPVESILIVAFTVFAVVVGIKAVAALVLYELHAYMLADRVTASRERLAARTATRRRLLGEIEILRMELSEFNGSSGPLTGETSSPTSAK